MFPAIGFVVLILMVFGGFAITGGALGPVMKALPAEMMIIGGAAVGALIIGILDNGLNLMGVNSDWQFIIKGVVILGAVYMDFLRSRKRAKG